MSEGADARSHLPLRHAMIFNLLGGCKPVQVSMLLMQGCLLQYPVHLHSSPAALPGYLLQCPVYSRSSLQCHVT
eukprot:1158198-Pelagomonas_calceolata.AAC.8